MPDRDLLYQSALKTLQDTKQLRKRSELEQGTGLFVTYNGQCLLNLASNNYLGLAGHPALAAAAKKAITVYGTSSGASRLVSGNFKLLDTLENELSLFHGCQSALAVNSGYAANLALCTALADRHSVIFSDKLNHASITDGILLSRAKHIRYRHNDMEHLCFQLKKYKQAKHKLLITDSIFSMDGDLANLPALTHISRDHNLLLLVDEAHATGIYGRGRGLSHELGLEKEVDVVMGTFSKALGSQGGYLCARKPLIDMVVNAGRSCIFSTAPPPAVVGANLAALELIATQPETGQKLLTRTEHVRDFLREHGFQTGCSASHILPVLTGSNENTMSAHRLLVECGVLSAAIRPPAVPQNTARLRLALRADMEKEHVSLLLKSMKVLSRHRTEK